MVSVVTGCDEPGLSGFGSANHERNDLYSLVHTQYELGADASAWPGCRRGDDLDQ